MADEWVVSEIGRLIRQAIRDTDLLGRTREGTLSLMLAGIDVERATGVIDRLKVLLTRHGMAPGLQISVGAACCPTHAVRVDELMQYALSRRTRGWQERKDPPTL